MKQENGSKFFSKKQLIVVAFLGGLELALCMLARNFHVLKMKKQRNISLLGVFGVVALTVMYSLIDASISDGSWLIIQFLMTILALALISYLFDTYQKSKIVDPKTIHGNYHSWWVVVGLIVLVNLVLAVVLLIPVVTFCLAYDVSVPACFTVLFSHL